MKILIVSPVPTDPPTAGNRARVAMLFAAMVRLGHDVTFAYVPYETADYERMQARLGRRLRVLQASPPPFQGIAARLQRKVRRILRLESAHLWKVDEWFDRSLEPQIRQLHAKESFDVVLIEYVFLSRLITTLPTSVRTIIDTNDLMGNRHKLYLGAGMRPQWFATSRTEEVCALNRAKAVIAIQQEDADYLERNVAAEVFCVGHLLDMVDDPQPDPGGTRILFVGSANPINVQGLEWFVDTAFPQIRNELPNSELVIAGPAGHGRSWPEGVFVLGEVDSVAEAYAHATIVINPVQFGTGLPVKTVEALCYGKPIVATPAGVRGLETDFHQAIAVGEDPNAFAKQVLALLKSKDERQVMSRHAIAAAGAWQQRHLAALDNALRGQAAARGIERPISPERQTVRTVTSINCELAE